MLTNTQHKELYQFLGGHWHDRPELGNDDAIIADIAQRSKSYHISNYIRLIQSFLASPESNEEKEAFIRETVWLHLPQTGEAIEWLEGILHKLEEVVRSE